MLELSGSVALYQLMQIYCFVKLARVLLELQWIERNNVFGRIWLIVELEANVCLNIIDELLALFFRAGTCKLSDFLNLFGIL